MATMRQVRSVFSLDNRTRERLIDYNRAFLVIILSSHWMSVLIDTNEAEGIFTQQKKTLSLSSSKQLECGGDLEM